MRPGFTLVELLMVMLIIIFLAGILIVVLGQAGGRAREKATQALITKLSKQVQERLEALDRFRNLPPFQDDANNFVTTNSSSYTYMNLSFLPNPNLTKQMKTTLWLKMMMKLHFPQSFSELRAMEIDLPQYTNRSVDQFVKLKNLMTNPAKHTPDTESSELLYFILTTGQGFGVPTVDPNEYRSSEVADTDGDGLMEFIDAWGRPLRFYRWPTRLVCPSTTFDANGRPTVDRTQGAIALDTALPAAESSDPLADPLLRDQDDPTYTIQLWVGNPNAATKAATMENNFHTPIAWHQFLIVSSGPDGQKVANADDAFGLYSPSDQFTLLDMNYTSPPLPTPNYNSSTNYGYLCQPVPGKFDALSDNISNRNR